MRDDMHVVIAWDGGEPTILDDKHSELIWFVLEVAAELPDLALDGYRPLFRQLAVAPSTNRATKRSQPAR
jgi:8-oxo-dGTP diphosphatase